MIKVLHIKKSIWKHEHAIYVYKSVKSHILFLNKKLNQLTSRCSRAEIRYADGLLLLRGLRGAEITDAITAPEPCSQRQPFSSEASHRQSSSRNSNTGAEPQRPASESYRWRWRRQQMRQCPNQTGKTASSETWRQHRWTGSENLRPSLWCPSL